MARPSAGLGFAGIGIALLGRNNAIGIAFAALLWSYLDTQSNGLQIRAGVAPELVNIIQGIILFAIVIAYEGVRHSISGSNRPGRPRTGRDARPSGGRSRGMSAPTTHRTSAVEHDAERKGRYCANGR